MNSLRTLFAATVMAAVTSGADAALVTSFTEDVLVDFETVVGGPGPVDISADATLIGFGYPPAMLEVGMPAYWSLGENGFWSLGKTFAGHDAAIGGMIVSFNGKTVESVGAVFNYLQVPASTPLQIVALDVHGEVLEGHSVTIDTPMGENEGVFYGITRPTADIGGLMVTAPYVVMDDFKYTAPVPEPTTYAMLFGGLALLGLIRHRSTRR